MDRRKFLLTTGASLATAQAHASPPPGKGWRKTTTETTEPVSEPVVTEPVTEPVSTGGLNDRRRFLDQATMGARPGEAEALTGSLSSWIEAQFTTPYTEIDHAAAYEAGYRNISGGNHVTRIGVFARWCNEDAQLRFRVAHVLQQIVCCGSSSGNVQLDALLWWNGLMSRAFSNYRDVLRLSITHRFMGGFLNNLANNASNGRAPSQNLARELLQLFSMGIHSLNKDGTPIIDSSGNAVPAYRQEDVDALARLLCGWNLPFANNTAGLDGTLPDGTMMIQASLAYNGIAVTFLGRQFAQISSPSATDVINRMDACLDLIMAQQSTAAYISKQFIQKMVTDSPSAAYISRVTSVFENNGSGLRGDLKALVKAVLLDPEARGDSKPLTFGRAQEWVLSLTKAMRYAEMEPLFDAYSPLHNSFAHAWGASRGNPVINILGEMGQAAITPESVFNDYPIEYMIGSTNAPAAAMWRAPQILANVSRAMSFSNDLSNPLPSVTNDPTGRWLLSELVNKYEAIRTATDGTDAQKQSAAVAFMVDKVFADINQGRQMTPLARANIINLIDKDFSALPARRKLAWLINFVRCLPETAVVI